MTKLVLSMMLAAFAVAVQAADNKALGDKDSSCCGQTKTSTEAKAECPMAKQGKATCPYMARNTTKEVAAKPALTSPKALADARK
ncbi:MAG TPA: hypothetical protein VNZ64_08355 [Candidatus Acidoferrum sp.]|jgi:hypothetical protein|nr:hypothetical protein [Candidatus Acidoferrum sp.]